MSTAEEPLLISGARTRKLLGIGVTKHWRMRKEGTIQTVDLAGRKMDVYASVKALAERGSENAKPRRRGRQPEQHAD